MDNIQNLSHLFIKCFLTLPDSVSQLPASGGNRRYYRMEGGGKRCLGVVADSRRDMKAYIGLTDVFRSVVNVPEVYAADYESGCYLVRDLGDTSLFSLLGTDRLPGLMRKAIDLLVSMQNVSPELWSGLTEYEPFGKREILWDLNYFKYDFLKPAGVEFDEYALEQDFSTLSARMESYVNCDSGFMYRDFQSRNIMVSDDEPWFIDFQGGRRGPVMYDAVSLLWQARAGFSDEFRRDMMEHYINETAAAREMSAEQIAAFRDSVPYFVLFRTLQVLGAYGFRGLIEKRAHFIESIPGAIRNLNEVMPAFGEEYPELRKIALQLSESPRFNRKAREGLEVTVFSFSYKKGYPEDLSGNGGGFMFDCRGMHNPGRYEQYRSLTGKDQPVIDFLKEKGEADEFARKAFEIVAPSVKRYLVRGFTSLQIGFGCTGGQHRSVYCAEAVAHALAGSFPGARITIIHREQGMTEHLWRDNKENKEKGGAI